MAKKIIIISLLLVSAAGAIFIGWQQTRASRIVLESGDLYNVSETLGAKKISDVKDVKFIFDQQYGQILYGRGWQGAKDDSEMIGGTELWLRKSGSEQDKKLSDDKVTYAFFGKNPNQAFYTSENWETFRIDTENGTKTKVAEKSLFPNLSADGKELAYQKLNADWQPGNYFDGALGIAVTNLETKEEKMITNVAEDFNPMFSPDTNKILFFSRSAEGLASHFIMNVDGSNRIQLTNEGETSITDKTIPIPSERPIWSKDGLNVVYESDRSIWRIKFNADLTKIEKAENIAYGVEPQWNKDGESITVVQNPKGGEKSIETINLEK